MKKRLISVITCLSLVASMSQSIVANATPILPTEDSTDASYVEENSMEEDTVEEEEVFTESVQMYNAARASNNYVPELNVYQNGASPKIEIGVDMADSDVLFVNNLTGSYGLRCGSANSVGNQSVSGGVYHIHDTVTSRQGNEWWTHYGDTSSEWSRFYITQRARPQNGQWMSVSLRARGSGNSYIESVLEAYEGTRRGIASSITYAERVNFNNKPRHIRVNVPSGWTGDKDIDIVTRKGTHTNGVKYSIASGILHCSTGIIDINNYNSTYGNDSIFEAGEQLLNYSWLNTNKGKNLQNDNQWHFVNYNQKLLDDTTLYDFPTGGMNTYFRVRTDSDAYIDTIKIGKASKVEVVRDGYALVYSDYDSEFVDSGAAITPNSPSITSASTNDNNIKFNFRSNNKSETHNYTARSLGSSGNNPSAWSRNYSVNLVSNIVGYSVVVDRNANTNPSNNINNNNGTTELTGYRRGDVVYCHVKSVDQNGTWSNPVHYRYVVGQTALDLRDDVSNYINNLTLVNSLNTNNIRNDLVALKTNSNLTYNVGNFSKTNATAKRNGNLQGAVTLASSVGNVNVNKVIPARPEYQIATELHEDVQEFVRDDFPVVDNNLDVNSLRTNLFSLRTNLARTIGLDTISLTPATEYNSGALSGEVELEAGNVSLYRVIDESLSLQTLDEAKEVTDSVISSYLAVNTSTQDDFMVALNQVINLDKYTISIEDWNLQESTESDLGRLTARIVLTSIADGGTRECTVDKSIEKTYQQLSTVYNTYVRNIEAYTPSNATTESDILSLATITNPAIQASIVDFNVTPATEVTRGRVTGTLKVKDNINEVEYTFNRPINYLPQSVQTVLDAYAERLGTFIPTDDTTQSDVLGLVDIVNSDISSYITEWRLITATDVRDGRLTGILHVKNSVTNEDATAPIALDIPYLSSELATSVNRVQDFLNSYTVTNNVDLDALLVSINNQIGTLGTFAYYDYDEGAPNLVQATETTEGSLRGNVVVAKGEERVVVPINKTINRVPQTVAGVKDLCDELLRLYNASNNTSESSLLAHLSSAITGVQGSAISLSIENFNKVESDEANAGRVTGRVVITDGSTSDYLDIDKVIPLASQSLDYIAQRLVEVAPTFHVYNEMSSDELLTDCRSIITGAGDNVIGMFITDYRVTPSTVEHDGIITANVVCFDSNGDIREVPLSLTIRRDRQSLADAVSRVNAILEDLVITNDVDEVGMWRTLSRAIIDIDSNEITINVNDWQKVNSTKETAGLLECNIVVSDGTDSETIPYAYIIRRVQFTDDEKKDLDDDIKKVIGGIVPPPGTTPDPTGNYGDIPTNPDKIIEYIYRLLGRNDITIEWKNYNKIEPTGDKDGRVTGTLVVKDLDGNVLMEIPVDYVLPRLWKDNTADRLNDIIKEIIKSIPTGKLPSGAPVGNTSEDIIKYIKEIIGDPNVIVEWDSDYIRVEPTAYKDGYIKGTILVKDTLGNLIKKYPIDIVLKKTGSGSSGGGGSSHHSSKDDDDKDKTANGSSNVTGSGQEPDKVTNDSDNPYEPLPDGDRNDIIYGSVSGKLDPNAKLPNITQNRPYSYTDKYGNRVVVYPSPIHDATEDGKSKTTGGKLYLASDIVTLFGTPSNTTSVVNYDWYAYKNNVLVNKGVAGVAYNGSTLLGTLINAVNPVDSTTNVNISFVGDKELTDLYVYNGTVNKYLATGLAVTNIDSRVMFTGTNKDMYAVLKPGVSSANFVPLGWYSDVPNQTRRYVANGNFSIGWVKDNGNWYYMDNAGKIQTGWIKDSNKWYYLDSLGVMQTGWNILGGKWYYLKNSGEMATGWIKDNGSWYFLNSDGSMARNTTISGYRLDGSGRWVS